jgi:hypothetical protein
LHILSFNSRGLREKYEIIHNVTLRTEDGTTQIDHIILSIFSIFVVEKKNMKGWIFGSEKEPFWTQQIFRFKTQFQNPLRQNYKHTQTLAKMLSFLGIENENIFSLVVFVSKCNLWWWSGIYVKRADFIYYKKLFQDKANF